MTDKPIPFTGSMVRAILREIEQPGTGKTMTRRVIKRLRRFGDIREFGKSDTPGYDWHFRDRDARVHDLRHNALLSFLPYRVGDRLYAREAWRCDARLNKKAPREIATNYPGIKYVATAEPDDFGIEGKFRQGMHMPRWASRITLIVTDERVERLQDISEADAMAEGIQQFGRFFGIADADWDDAYHSSVSAFRHLWDSLNAKREGGKYAWDKNPWVSVTSFRPILGNIDQIAEAA